MIPGEIIVAAGEIELNAGRATVTVTVANAGDRPIQVGSHYHFYETTAALQFDREQARGFRLDIPAGTATRFEPGQTREVRLVAYAGARRVIGFTGRINGPLSEHQRRHPIPPSPPAVRRGVLGMIRYFPCPSSVYPEISAHLLLVNTLHAY